MAIKIPSLLNYTRSIVPSEGVFWAVRDRSREPLGLNEKTVLGTIASYSGVYKSDSKQKSEDEVNKAQEAGANNIQRVDSCHLPPGCDTFDLEFTLKFLPNAMKPETCNDPEFAERLEGFSAAYSEKGGFRHLASMYFARICNGSFLWRNRYGTNRKIKLEAPFEPGRSALELEVRDFAEPLLPTDLSNQLSPWVDGAADAFSGKTPYFVVKVSAQVKIGEGQEVYPSQEFVENAGKKSKTLFGVILKDGERSAGMHSQKIGNAIRTIDIWYPGATKDKPLAVDPFTVDKRRGKTVRLPTRESSDFYSYLKAIDDLTKEARANDASAFSGRLHYTAAVLVRGGVFSGEKANQS